MDESLFLRKIDVPKSNVMRKCFFIFLLFVGLLSAIAQDSTEMQRVMEMHDIVMDKMPALGKMVQQLKTAAQNSEDKSKYELAIEDLMASNKSMQNWMIGFGKRFDADEMMKGKELTVQKKAWLQQEKTKVIALDKEIDGSLAKSQKLLDEKK